MWGPDTQEQALEGTFGSYHEMTNQDEASVPVEADEETGFEEEEGQELLLPTVTRYGLVRRVKSKLTRVKKKRVDEEDTLFDHAFGGPAGKHDKNSKDRMKQNLEMFFRNAGTIEAGSLKVGTKDETVTMIAQIIDQEFPAHKLQIPTGPDLIHIGEVKENRGKYSPGDWVEVEGHDLKWRLDMITRAIKQAPSGWDWNDPANEDKEPEWNFVYNAGQERNIKEEDLRSPEAGLKYTFGCRPWVWQQWAILKIEEKLRFQEGHHHDFAALDIHQFAANLWDQWLDHPANLEFKELFYDDRIGERGRIELVNHIQKPFQLIDSMGRKSKEWDFSDHDINVFTYVSLLGSGLLIPFLVASVQIAIPILLLMDADDSCKNGGDLEKEEFLTKVMAIVIFVYYMYGVIPDTYVTFYNVQGAADSVFSRLLSLRRMVWDQGDDSLMQMVGFKWDIFMNTAYQALLMMLNIYVILSTKDVIEVVLNSLAFIFIDRIDEDVAKSGWYDHDKRWLTAGAIETGLQATVQLRVLASPKLFSEKFDIHEELILTVCDDDSSLLCNHRIAGIDTNDPQYMTTEERIQLICGKVAQDSKNRYAIEEYKKRPVYFGLLESALASISRGKLVYSDPMFERFKAWRTWSRWDKVLFLSPVPILDDIFEDNDEGSSIAVPKAEDEMSSRSIPNFYPNESASSKRTFIQHYFNALVLRDIVPSLRPVCSVGRIFSLFFRLIDALLLHWLSHLILLIFPIYLLAAIFEVGYNVTYMKCFSPVEYLFVWGRKSIFGEDDYY